MTKGTGVLFHVTPESNAGSILTYGIIPSYSTGKWKVSWYVSGKKENILWSIAHVSASKHVDVSSLVVCAVAIDWHSMKRTARPGFYYTYSSYRVESISPAIMFIEMEK
jgi:hypothetical protein